MKFLYLLTLLGFLTACNTSRQQSRNEFIRPNLQLTTDKLTPEVLWSMGRIGQVKLSPDKQTIAFTLTDTRIDENRNYTDIYTIPIKGGAIQRVVQTYDNEFEVGWRPDGARITYLSAASGSVQLYEINPDGSQNRQITQVEGGIEGYLYAPTSDRLLIIKRVKMDQTPQERYPDMPKANLRIEDDLMYRHWDHWSDYSYNHLWLADYHEGKTASEWIDLLNGERFDSPTLPFGGIEQVAFTPDGKQITYCSKKLNGKAAAFSTNTDIYLYHIENKTTKNLTQGQMGYDLNPVFHPNGELMIWESMQRDGYEADKNRLMQLNLSTGQITDLSAHFDQNVHNLSYSSDQSGIWLTSNDKGTDQIFFYSFESNQFQKTTSGTFDYTHVLDAGDNLVATRMSMSMPTEIYLVDKQEGTAQNLSRINEHTLKQLKMGKVEERWIATTDQKQMHTWIVYPPNFDPNKKYPTLLYCQGGPQSTVSQFWSLRWNFQIMAANGYIIVAPNRRGLPGFGQQWNEQISGDYGGQNMQDYLSAIDALAKEPFVDADRMGAVGASYGGYSVYWLAGNHQKRFKAFISHCGIFNFEQMYSTTEELFFVEWDYKGAYWENSNLEAMKSYRFSPHKFIQNWDTPILVIHGEKDFRIPYTQGMAAFNSAIMKNLKARFVFFPDENHWMLQPQNSIVWQREYFRFLDEHLKN